MLSSKRELIQAITRGYRKSMEAQKSDPGHPRTCPPETPYFLRRAFGLTLSMLPPPQSLSELRPGSEVPLYLLFILFISFISSQRPRADASRSV